MAYNIEKSHMPRAIFNSQAGGRGPVTGFNKIERHRCPGLYLKARPFRLPYVIQRSMNISRLTPRRDELLSVLTERSCYTDFPDVQLRATKEAQITDTLSAMGAINYFKKVAINNWPWRVYAYGSLGPCWSSKLPS